MITQTPGGGWSAEIESTRRGRRRRWRKTFAGRAEAQAYENNIKQQLLLERSSRSTILDPALTLQSAWEQHCARRAARARTPEARKQHDAYVKRHAAALKRFPQELRLAHVTTADVLDYIDERRKGGAAEASIRNELTGLSTMCKALIQGGIVMNNPFRDGLSSVGTSRARVRRLTFHEFEILNVVLSDIQTRARQRLIVGDHLVAPTPGFRDLPGAKIIIDGPGGKTLSIRPTPGLTQIHAAFIAAIETTLRASKLFGLKRSDIKQHQGIRYIAPAQSETINKSVPRAIPISSVLGKVLEAAEWCRWGGPDAPLFAGLRPDYAYRILRNLAELFEFKEPLRWHDLRHEGISRLGDAGWSPSQMQAVSGHKTLDMLSRYTHPDLAVIHELMMKKQ